MVVWALIPAMKNLLFVFLVLFSLNSFAQISIISDLDDTIKITEAGGNPTDIIGDDVYIGMPQFLSEAKAYAPTLYILSASPSFMEKKIRSTLRLHQISVNELILRRNIFEDKFSYKVKEIQRIMDASTDDFILIGDDFGKDPEVYAEIERLYPGRVLGTYIHKVKGRDFRATVTYWTSFDLFLREFEAFRMSADSVERAIEVLAAEKNLDMIFPKKAHCPTAATVWEWQTRTIFMQEAQKLISKFTKFCQARQSDIIPQLAQ
jgi:Uncharacterized conserved protein (DUF2183)